MLFEAVIIPYLTGTKLYQNSAFSFICISMLEIEKLTLMFAKNYFTEWDIIIVIYAGNDRRNLSHLNCFSYKVNISFE